LRRHAKNSIAAFDVCTQTQLIPASGFHKLTLFCAISNRYDFKKSTIAASLSKDLLDVSFWHQPNDLLQLGATFMLNAAKARGSFFYQLDLRDAVIRAMLSTDLSVGCTYSRYVWL